MYVCIKDAIAVSVLEPIASCLEDLTFNPARAPRTINIFTFFLFSNIFT